MEAQETYSLRVRREHLPWLTLLPTLSAACALQLAACNPAAKVTMACDCQPLERCVDGECRAIACEDDTGCPPASACIDRVCSESSCQDDADCPGGRCVDGGCYSLQCVDDETQECTSGCGVGTEKCVNGVWRGCDAPQPSAEQCGDGVDNNCDGDTDEGCAGCSEGTSRPCSTDCGEGEELCAGGEYQACDAPQPEAEVCGDGADNDCDDEVDEDCGACTGDRFEDNNSKPTAATMAAGSYAGLQICPGDEDWYEVTLDPDQGLVASISFADVDGDIDLKAEDAYGILVDSSLSVGDDETVAIPNVTLAGPFFLRVYGFGGAVDNAYALEVSLFDVSTCVDDRYEDHDSHAQARSLSGNGRTAYPYLRVCAEDEDWYKVYLSSGESLVVDLRFTDEVGDLELAIYNADETRLTGGLTTTDDEHAEVTAAASGYHYIRVYGFLDAENNYEMTVDVP